MSLALRIRFEMPSRAVTRHILGIRASNVERSRSLFHRPNFPRFASSSKLLVKRIDERIVYMCVCAYVCVSAAEIREALQHAMKVSREGSCRWPRPRVIPVRDVYPSPSTTYIPHCAILHRCSDDTGCCRSEALTCVPKHSHRVELFFYVSKSSIRPDANRAPLFATVLHHAN